MVGYDLTDLAVLAVGLLVTGVFGGLIAGLLGVGGGIVVVPVLYHLFTALGIDESVRMHLAVGTSLATIVPTSIASARSHYRRGATDFALLRAWGPAVFVGVLAGTALAGVVRGPVLSAVFATVALLVAAQMALAPEGWRVAARLPTGPASYGIPFAIGAFSAMMGIGGGTLSVPTMTACGYPIHRAVGTAAAIGLIIAVPGAIGFVASGLAARGIEALGLPVLSLGYVSLPGLVLISPTSILCAPLGARLAHSLSRRWLRLAFALFLALTSMRMFASLI